MNLADYTWHALWCRPQLEMATAYRFGAMGLAYIVPVEKRWEEVRAGRTRKRLRTIPVFPRCVFTGFRDPPNWFALQERVPAYQGYLTFGRGPEKFKLADMEWLWQLRKQLLGEEEPKPFADSIKPGDKVRVARGVLAGQVLTVNEVDAKKIHTFKEFLGGMRIVQISLADLAPID